MSERYGVPAPRDTAANGQSSSVETAKHEAGELKDTAVSEAGHVAETAKDEAKAVASEVKYQAKDLYAQTQRELKDQAQVQQQRAASGLRSVSDELDSMTANAENPGLAADLLRQSSRRLSSAAIVAGRPRPELGPAEVKSFARRKPGTFIIGAAILGIIAGRLTRALAANASDAHADAAAARGSRHRHGRAGLPAPSAQRSAHRPPTVEETPVFAQSSAGAASSRARDVGDVRSDSF